MTLGRWCPVDTVSRVRGVHIPPPPAYCKGTLVRPQTCVSTLSPGAPCWPRLPRHPVASAVLLFFLYFFPNSTSLTVPLRSLPSLPRTSRPPSTAPTAFLIPLFFPSPSASRLSAEPRTPVVLPSASPPICVIQPPGWKVPLHYISQSEDGAAQSGIGRVLAKQILYSFRPIRDTSIP